MKKYYVLYNPKANNGKCADTAKLLSVILVGEINYVDILKINSYKRFFSGLDESYSIVICGGDGTLNKFINQTKGIDIVNDVYYYPCGTGNDFYKDVNQNGEELIKINGYLKNLPTVEVNGEKHIFINGVGYGIDGYCCEEGDRLHAKNKNVDYTKIAILGLLFKYKPTNAKVIVDGVEHSYKKVWLAPTMYGKYYGGGMMPCPEQSRSSEEKFVSVMIFHGSNKLKTLMIFPNIFKGEHVKSKKHVEVLSGKNIEVIFDSKRAVQIDGETISGILSYKVSV